MITDSNFSRENSLPDAALTYVENNPKVDNNAFKLSKLNYSEITLKALMCFLKLSH